MNTAILNRNLRKLHLWFGIAIGVQIGLWLISGLFMTLFPIEQVRGDNLRVKTDTVLDFDGVIISPQDLLKTQDIKAQALTLKTVSGEPVYILKTEQGVSVFDARTGVARAPLSEGQAREISMAAYSGRGTVSSTLLYADETPHEYGRDGPVWRVNFSKPNPASFYVDAKTGELKAVRTRLWRTFDFMWGLHIMDWKTRDNFNSWWLKTVAALAVFFFFTGLGLAVLRIRGALARRRHKTKAGKLLR